MKARSIILKDATLREGLDTPDVFFSPAQRRVIARLLERTSVREAEVVAPSRVFSDLDMARNLKQDGVSMRLSGLIYAYSSSCAREIEAASGTLDRFDLLMPASPERAPKEPREKIRLLMAAVKQAAERKADFGVGFPHCFQSDAELVRKMAEEAERAGAQRVTLYDTNGSQDPSEVRQFVKQVKKAVDVPVFFHGHNDLGMATANSLAAVQAGADGLDVTVNGLGDRAGNAALEQVAAALHLKGYGTGIWLENLKELCDRVAEQSGLGIAKLAPVVGEYVCYHRSPSHLSNPSLFEAFDPSQFRATRKLAESAPREKASKPGAPSPSGEERITRK